MDTRLLFLLFWGLPMLLWAQAKPAKPKPSSSKPKVTMRDTKPASTHPKSATAGSSLPTSVVLLPPDYDPSRMYAALVLMPYTGGSSIDFFNKYLREANISAGSQQAQFAEFLEIYKAEYGQDKSFVLILTHGVGGTEHHSASGFGACVQQYEKRLQRDLPYFTKKYNLDPSKIFIGGVSLGGDLSWALSVLHPEMFQGAIVTGSRCSFPPGQAVSAWERKDYFFFMVMGMNEAPERLSGMSYARKLLSAGGVRHIYREMPFLEHDRAPLWLWMEAIETTLFAPKGSLGKSEADSLAAESLLGDYEGTLETKKYVLEKEEDLLKKGDGLWLLQKHERTDDKHPLRIYKSESGKTMIQFPATNQLPPLECYVRVRPDGEIALQIPEQDISGYKYIGTAAEMDSPQHGFRKRDGKLRVFSVDFERYQAKTPHQRTNFSFYSIEE